MDLNIMKEVFDKQMNEFLWWALGIAFVLMFKNAIENYIWGLTFMFDHDYNVDDEVLIGGVRKARIVRQTIYKTVFYIYDNNTRLVIPNKELHSLRCEKILVGNPVSPKNTDKTNEYQI
jgi:hypothetical protein